MKETREQERKRILRIIDRAEKAANEQIARNNAERDRKKSRHPFEEFPFI